MSSEMYVSTGDEAYSRPGTEFHFGFFNNLRFASQLSEANLRVQVTSDDVEPATVRVSYEGSDGDEVIVGPGETVSIPVDLDLRLGGIGERDKAVVVESINGQGISVAGLSEEITSGDSFCVFAPVFFPATYEYYAVSVPRTQIVSISDGVVEIIEPEEKSAFLIVTTEDSTEITLTLTQTVSTDGADDLSEFGPTINSGETISLMLNRDQTLYISSVDDLTGSHVATNKPITFLSGHECGMIPQTMEFCDTMIEQIPPTVTWGVEFYTAPILTRRGGDAFIVVASEDETTFFGVCNDISGEEVTRMFERPLATAGDSINFNISSFEFCRFTSDKPVLLAQLSLASGSDGNENADPFMVLIPPLRQYRDSVSFRIFQTVIVGLNESHFVNIILPAVFDRNGVLLNDEQLPEGIWSPILCDGSGELVCAYAAQVQITRDTQTVSHIDADARISVIVYSLAFRTGQGFSAGMMQRPIACMYIHTRVFLHYLVLCVYMCHVHVHEH